MFPEAVPEAHNLVKEAKNVQSGGLILIIKRN